jgi:hypothetical protein
MAEPRRCVSAIHTDYSCISFRLGQSLVSMLAVCGRRRNKWSAAVLGFWNARVRGGIFISRLLAGGFRGADLRRAHNFIFRSNIPQFCPATGVVRTAKQAVCARRPSQKLRIVSSRRQNSARAIVGCDAQTSHGSRQGQRGPATEYRAEENLAKEARRFHDYFWPRSTTWMLQ